LAGIFDRGFRGTYDRRMTDVNPVEIHEKLDRAKSALAQLGRFL
jgi:hypothetical protein